MGDYTTAISVTIGQMVALTVPAIRQFLQPNDDDFGDITRIKRDNTTPLPTVSGN